MSQYTTTNKRPEFQRICPHKGNGDQFEKLCIPSKSQFALQLQAAAFQQGPWWPGPIQLCELLHLLFILLLGISQIAGKRDMPGNLFSKGGYKGQCVMLVCSLWEGLALCILLNAWIAVWGRVHLWAEEERANVSTRKVEACCPLPTFTLCLRASVVKYII